MENNDKKRKFYFLMRSSKLLIVALACFVLLVIITAQMTYRPMYHNDPFTRTKKSKHYLSEYRKLLESYYRENKRYPESSDVKSLGDDVMKEYISAKEGSSKLAEKLDNQGGWFYNQQTGDIRINLAFPLSNYFLDYQGSDRNEIPSEW